VIYYDLERVMNEGKAMSESLKNKLKNQILIFDGANGTEFYKHGVFVNASFEGLNLSNPALVKEIHQNYVNAGADVITTNSYGANSSHLANFGLAEKSREINLAAARIAREAIGNNDILIAGSVGPVGKTLLHGAPDTEDAVQSLVDQINALLEGGVDFILGESISSLDDAMFFAEAIKLTQPREYVASFVVNSDLVNNHGEPLTKLLRIFDALPEQPAAIGLNCNIGPDAMLPAVEKLLKLTTLPVIVQPNAGTPKNVENRFIYMSSPEYLTTYALRYLSLGVRAVGGCCGITPEHIAELAKAAKPLTAKKHEIVSIVNQDPPQTPSPVASRSKFAAKIINKEFVTSVEITPPKGYDLAATVEKAKICAAAGIDAINIPDGPRASARISPVITALAIQNEAKIEAVLHVCCRDRNLIGMQSDLLGCAASKINNILFITGDPPKLGDYPFASAVFDVDSIGCLEIAGKLNTGLDLAGKSIGQVTHFFGGSGADPNALDMTREINRLRLKVQAGAQYIITQPVFAIEPLLAMIDAVADPQIPIIAGIWPLSSLRNAQFMKTEVPGVVVPDDVMEKMARYSNQDDQRKMGIEIARETYAKLRPHIAGLQVSAPFGNVKSALEVFQ